METSGYICDGIILAKGNDRKIVKTDIRISTTVLAKTKL